LVRGKATKNNLLQLVEKAKFIHIASHGIFNKSDPLSSGLLLAGNPFEEIADVLTARELYSLKFNADLITLSACDTGLGKISNGDDVLGLVRGFIFSGAKNIISTLWPIDDEFTKKLMVNFYTNVKNGDSLAVALRTSQLKVMKENSNPLFWAAFELTGTN